MTKGATYVHKATVLVLVITYGGSSRSQELMPSPPADHTLIYTLDSRNNLPPLPFEQGQTPLRADKVARDEKVSYIEIKGTHAATVLKADTRLFLFTNGRQG